MSFNIVKNDKKEQEEQMFFGKYSKYLRVDKIPKWAEVFKTLKENSEGNTWFAKEIDYKQDKTRFDDLPEDAKRAFKLNISYQTLMDSGVTSGISEVLNKCVSSSMLDLLYRRITIEESIHSESYSYGLSQTFGSSANEILDLVYEDEFVKERMNREKEVFANLYDLTYTDNFPYDDEEKMDELKLSLLKVLIGVYVLEGIKFPFSFLVTFSINDKYDNAIPGFTRTLQLIAHDELNTHVPTTRHIVAIMREDADQGFTKFFQRKDGEKSIFEDLLEKIIDDTVESEIKWANYLFENRNVKSLSVESCEYFIKWRANFLYEILGIIRNPYSDYVPNSITEFFETYRDINKQNAAAQETALLAYTKGGVVNDWPEGEIK